MNKKPERNSEEYKKKANLYARAHQEAVTIKRRNPEYREKSKIWNKRAYEKNREKYTVNLRERNRVGRIKIIEFLGGVCVVCGELDWRCLQIDHINGNGRKERLRFKSSGLGPYYSDIREHPEKYQILCANHNWIKRYEQDELRKRKDQ